MSYISGKYIYNHSVTRTKYSVKYIACWMYRLKLSSSTENAWSWICKSIVKVSFHNFTFEKQFHHSIYNAEWYIKVEYI